MRPPVPLTRCPSLGSSIYELRKHPLRFPLRDDELATFRTKGFVVVRGVIDLDEVATVIEEGDRVLASLDAMNERFGLEKSRNLRLGYDYPTNTGTPMPTTSRKIESITRVSPMFMALSTDPRICDRLSSIYDGYPPRLFNDMLSFKPPRSPALQPHQDLNWWRGFANSIVSVSVALNPTTKENGCTEMWTGYQRGLLHDESPADTITSYSIDLARLANEEHTFVELQPGDAVFFHSLTPHTAGPNESPDYRRAVFLVYNDAREGEHYSSYAEHYRWYRTHGSAECRHEAEHYFFL